MRLLDAADAEVAQAQLAEELRRLRKAARRTGEYIAKAAGLSASRLSRIENCLSPARPDEISNLLAVLPVSPADYSRIVMLADLASSDAGDPDELTLMQPAFTNKVVGRLEDQAMERHELCGSVISGLLQTAAYVEAIIASRYVDPVEVAEGVRARLDRQALLFDKSKSFYLLHSEHVLRLPLVDELQMQAQLNQIRALASLEQVHFGVVPNRSLQNAQLITTNIGLFDQEYATVEHTTGIKGTSDKNEVAILRAAFENGARVALWDDDAITFLSELFE